MQFLNNKNEDYLIFGLEDKNMILVKYYKNKTSMQAIYNRINGKLKYYPDFYVLGEQITDLSKTPEAYNLSNSNKFIEVRDRFVNEKFDPTKYEETFSLFVKSLNNKSIILAAHNEMTIFELKLQIQEKDGSPIKQQRLIFAGHQLEDNRVVSDYMLKKDSNINLVYRLSGGMMSQISGKDGSFNNLEFYMIDVKPDLC